MISGINDRIGSKLEALAYLTDKLAKTNDANDKLNLRRVFYDENDVLREFKDENGKPIKELNDFAKNLDTYKDEYKDLLDSYKLEDTKVNDNTSFKALTISNTSNSDVFLVPAGTDFESVKAGYLDIKNDLQMATGNSPSQMSSYEELYRETVQKYPNSKIILISHSLMASVSELLAVKYVDDGRIKGVLAYNPFGVYDIIQNDPILSVKYNANKEKIDAMIVAKGNALDGVFTSAKQVGSIKDVFSKDGIYVQPALPFSGDPRLFPYEFGELINSTLKYHPISNYDFVSKDADGNLISGKLDARKFLNAMQKDPDNGSLYMSIYDAIHQRTQGNSIPSFVDECVAQGVMDGLFPLSGTQTTLNSIMAGRSVFSSAGTAYKDPLAIDLDGSGTLKTAG